MVVTRGEGNLEDDEEEREGQTYGGKERGIFKWWAHNGVYRCHIMKLYTWNLNDVINQSYPNNFNFKKEYMDLLW